MNIKELMLGAFQVLVIGGTAYFTFEFLLRFRYAIYLWLLHNGWSEWISYLSSTGTILMISILGLIILLSKSGKNENNKQRK